MGSHTNSVRCSASSDKASKGVLAMVTSEPQLAEPTISESTELSKERKCFPQICRLRVGVKLPCCGVAMFKKVLVPLDGSEVAKAILTYVSQLAKGLNIPIVLLFDA